MKQESEIVRFFSKYRELKIVVKPGYYKEVDGRTLPMAGKAIQFHDSTYETSDPGEIEFLRTHKNFGSIFDEVKINGSALKNQKSLEQLEKENAELRARITKGNTKVAKTTKRGTPVEDEKEKKPEKTRKPAF